MIQNKRVKIRYTRVKIRYTNYSNIHDNVLNHEVERFIRNTITVLSQKKVIYTQS